MVTKVFKDPRATELCDEIRRLYNINSTGGWIARPRHGEKQICIGHPEYGQSEEISSQVDALYMALDRLGCAEKIGYTLEIVT